ncbi:MAG: tetratricopeptide repeat protein, partial [Acetobacteraceae bacterium]|nr:tetratricopeptide repeat protein [Acetobacteraceae bacterium]
RDLRRFDEAEEACRAVLADEPVNTGASMSLGHALRGRGDAAGALALFQAALAARPGDAWARLSAADALADLGRLDEAEDVCRTVLADKPENAGALMSLGRLAMARADRRAGADWFERAARAAPDFTPAHLGLADALRDLGEYEAAADAANAILARKPDLADGWMSLGHTERRAGRREAALEAFTRASDLKPGSPGPLVQMALEERRLGRPEASGRLLERALEADGGDAEALMQLGEHFRLAGVPDRALELFRKAAASARPAPWAYLAASQVLVDLGELDAALRTLDEAEARLGAKPDIAAKRAELLRRTGDWAGARAVVEAAAPTWPRHFGVWCERAHLERVSGGPEGFAASLREAPVGNTHERARVHILQGLAAAERWSPDEAQEHYAQAIELNPDDGWLRACMAQTRLLALDTEGAREQLQAAARLDRSAARMQGRSANASQTHLGHLLDEFVLDRRALAELQALRGLPPEKRVGPLLALVRHYPEYTPAAIGLLTALRQSGRLAAPRPPSLAAVEASPISRAVAQHWNDVEVPADMGRVMGSWGKLYPGFALRRFSDEQARAFLARFHPPEVQAAHRRSQDPAQRADIFRLAHLWSEGGYHTDAENRLVGDFGELRIPGARLVLHQESFGTIGTAFIGAVPGHPLIGRALRLAVEAVNRGDGDMQWLSTGPGLLTRAFADLLADPGREPLAALDHTVVLEHGELQRAVAVHCLVGRGTVGR